MKRMTVLLMALVMLLTFAACGQPDTADTTTVPPTEPPMTAERLVQKLVAAADGKQITQAETSMELDYSVSADGVTMEVAMDLAMNMKTSAEPYGSYSDVTMTMDIMGEQTVETYQQYVLEEDGTVISYTHTDSTDSWEKLDMGTLGEEMKAQSADYQYIAELAPEAMTLAENTQVINGREAYVLSCTLTGEQMQKSADSFASVQEMLAGLGLGELDYTGLTALTTYYIDAETCLPVQMEMEIQGMDNMMSGMMDSLLGEEASDVEMEVEIPTCRMVYQNMSYDPVEIPAVPEEGLIMANQASFNPDQGDGTYIIQESGSAVKITCPEGWSVTDMDYNYLVMEADNGQRSATYIMYGNIDGGYVFVPFIERNEVIALDNYGSHGNTTMELDGNSYGALWVECTDGSDVNFAWDQMGDSTNYLYVKTVDKTGSSMEDSLATVLENVEEYQLIP